MLNCDSVCGSAQGDLVHVHVRTGYSKTSIKCALKNQINWGNNWKNSLDCEKASNLCHKFDAFSQS